MGRIRKELARRTLEKSALGIGERHDADDGRRFTCELLNETGLVRALFLEAKGRESLPAMRQAQAVQQQGGTPANIATEALGIIAPEHGAKVNVGHVAAVAIWRSIPVYCIDVYASDYGAASLKDGQREAVQVRDKVAAYLFTKIVERALGRDKTGCLVLYGASHFTGTNANWAKQTCLADYLQLDYVLFE